MKLTQFFIILIQLYQKIIAPLFPGRCKYYPSCSEYMIQSIKKYGAVKGFFKGCYRILRCNPFSKGGIDEP